MSVEEQDQLFNINDSLSNRYEKDRYRIIELLGRPDKSYLYKAFDNILEKFVTIRAMMPDQLLSDKSKENFLLRAGHLKYCKHQTILSILDYGILDSGVLYLAAEYEQGYTLADLLQVQQRLNIEEALPIFKDLCEALALTYRGKTVHGAICLKNIFLFTDPCRKRRAAKLGNFRISHFARPRINEKTNLKFGVTFADPTYMSPEECRGQAITHSSDIYSLGCVMYKVLSGITTISDKTGTEALYSHANELPLPLSQLIESLPFHLETMIMTAIQKIPSDRYHSAEELLNALDLVQVSGKIKDELEDKPFQRSFFNTLLLLIKYLFKERPFAEWRANHSFRRRNFTGLNLDKQQDIKRTT